MIHQSNNLKYQRKQKMKNYNNRIIRFTIAILAAGAFSLSSCGKKSVAVPGYDMIYSDSDSRGMQGFLIKDDGTNLNRPNQASYYIENSLNWAIHTANSAAIMIAEVKTKTRTGFYYRGHGIGSGGTRFVLSDDGPDEGDGTFRGMDVGGTLLSAGTEVAAKDITPAFSTYQFAFLNCCWSGLQPGATAFQTAFTKGGPKPTTYLGWSAKVNALGSALFASFFYEKCDGGTTVAVAKDDALTKVISDYPAYWINGTSPITYGDTDIKIDGTP
jgi:hypothetical protein